MKTLVTLVAFVALALPARSQTTGVPGINDLTVNGLGSGLPSCVPVVVTGATALTFSVSTTPGATVVIFGSPCKCLDCGFWLPPVACPLPFSVTPPCFFNPFAGPSNQSVDLNFLCPIQALFSGTALSSGVFSLTVPIPLTPPGSFCFSIQAAIIDSVCAPSSPFGVMVSQALDVTL